ncbi:MAG: bifunctional adenosylcobinamide kinase/adenosylcobinamide-phosphate guanylyltransferase [Treponema sp.]|nr:bifunctional adenosylcobinamide kinase/adenosylcobinamide-phosphate guanylyltransferase [Treponema sp.]
MVLIFGGAYQGKLAYALERFNLAEGDVYRCTAEDPAMPENKKIIYEIDKWILALIRAELDVTEAVRRFIDANPDTVVICNDISCGIVPVDAEMRKWREAAGRSMAEFSRCSDEVIRLFCGIPASNLGFAAK